MSNSQRSQKSEVSIYSFNNKNLSNKILVEKNNKNNNNNNKQTYSPIVYRASDRSLNSNCNQIQSSNQVVANQTNTIVVGPPSVLRNSNRQNLPILETDTSSTYLAEKDSRIINPIKEEIKGQEQEDTENCPIIKVTPADLLSSTRASVQQQSMVSPTITMNDDDNNNIIPSFASSPLNNVAVPAKLYFENSRIPLTVQSHWSCEELYQQIRSKLSINLAIHLTLKWVDDEEDACTISSQVELDEAIRCVVQSKSLDTLKIHIFSGQPAMPGQRAPGETKDMYWC